MLILGSPAGVLGAFTDEFTGVTLNTRWTQTTGSWSLVSGDATTSTPASSYPLLTFDANKKEVVVRAEPATTNTFGWGVAFWVVDSNNWWAVVADREEYTCQTGTTTGCCACGDGGISTGFPSCNCVYCDCGTCPSNPNCGQTQSAGTCTYPVYGTCYRYRVRILRRVSGTVTVIDSATLTEGNIGGSLSIGYVQAAINASGQITATAQMSTGGAVTTLTNTPSSPTKSNRHGAILTPRTTGTQESGLERFVYTLA